MEKTIAVERSLTIQADRERVWRAITTPEQISQWFDGRMGWEFKLGAGEAITFRYNGDVIGHGKIVTVEPPAQFAFHWTPEPGNPVETLVTFRLETAAEGTRVSISEAGFEALPADQRQRRTDMNAEGWGIALSHLEAYLRSDDSH